MKKLNTLLVGFVAAAVLPLSAAQYEFEAGDSSLETKICVAAAGNNLSQYKNAVDNLSSRHSIHRIVANKLTCNKMPIASFARMYDADNTVNFLAKYSDHNIIIRREVSSKENSKGFSQNKEKVIIVAD